MKLCLDHMCLNGIAAFSGGIYSVKNDEPARRPSVAARVGQDPMTVSRIWNRCFQDDNTERCAGSQWLPISSSQEDSHVTRMDFMDHQHPPHGGLATTSRALSQELVWAARQEMSVRTIR
ncbi:uncharacterized protein TNCV_112391 [Trichonephila clavipes]|nr:uncharacterized protein TNCV_112391 [Trichonephila clavipes]